MSFSISSYKDLINRFYSIMLTNEKLSDIKLGEDKWTLKEMIGHLIDSASNNHQRFIRLQLQKELELPGYEAEEWKQISSVQELDYSFLISFWKSYNDYLIHIIGNMKQTCLTNVWKSENGEKTLKFLVKDYFEHIKWHIDLFEKRVEEIRQRSI